MKRNDNHLSIETENYPRKIRKTGRTLAVTKVMIFTDRFKWVIYVKTEKFFN